MISLNLTLPSPLSPLSLSLPPSTPLSTLLSQHTSLPPSALSSLYLRTRSNPLLPSDATLGSLLLPSSRPSSCPSSAFAFASSSLDDSDDEEGAFERHVDVQVACRMLGGKGGFGAMLRATGGKMSSHKASNNDSCRDLSGRRLSTIKEAKKAAELLELEATHNQKTAEAARSKLESLERQLGISHASSSRATPTIGSSSLEEDDSSEAGPSRLADQAQGGGGGEKGHGQAGARTKLTQQDLVELAGKRHKFEDNGFFEESRELKEGVRSAVSAGLLKKRKKAKAASKSAAAAATEGDKTPTVIAA